MAMEAVGRLLEKLEIRTRRWERVLAKSRGAEMGEEGCAGQETAGGRSEWVTVN